MSNTPKKPPTSVTPANAAAFLGTQFASAPLTNTEAFSVPATSKLVTPPLTPQQAFTQPLQKINPYGTTSAAPPLIGGKGLQQPQTNSPLIPSKNTATAGSASQATIAPTDFSPSLQVDGLDPASVESVLAGLRDLSSFQENALQAVDNMTYHWRLFQTPDRDVMRTLFPTGSETPPTVTEYYNQLDKFEQVTIAETGTTGYNITSVQVESLVSPNFHSVALNTTSLVMNITEPNGVSFLDGLKNSAVQMKVRDYRKCWYYLELSFKGYVGGEVATNALAGEKLDNGGRWIWIVQITNIETKLSTGGGQYKLSMIPYSETAYDSEARNLPDAMPVEGETIDLFFQDFAKQLNDAWNLRQASDKYLVFQFQFHGIKGRKNVTADAVRNFSLKSPDTAYYDFIRHQQMNSSTMAASNTATPASSGQVVVSTAIPPKGSRASSEKLITLVNEIIPGVRINSGRRTVEHNREVGGKGTSQHIDGTAIDIHPPAMTPSALVAEFAKRGVQVDVINEGNHYHIQGARATTKKGLVDNSITPSEAKTQPKETAPTVGGPDVKPDSPIQIDALSGKPRGLFNRGTSIDEVVSTVFSCCEAAQVLIKDSSQNPYSADNNTDAAGNDQVNDKGFRESLVFRIEPEVRVLTYDPLFNKYGKFIIYHIYGYVTQAPILSSTQIIAANDEDVQKKMLVSLANQGLLRKRYDYLFTGMNTEIIDFDVSFDLLWAAALPRLLRNEVYTAQTRFNENLIKQVQSVDEAVSAQSLARDDYTAATDAVNQATAALNTDPTNADAVNTLNKAKQEQTITESILNDANAKIVAVRNTLLKKLPTIEGSEVLSGKRTYAETIQVASLPSVNYSTIALQYAQDGSKNSLNGGMVGQFHNGRTIFGTVMNQLEGQMNSSMVSITMKIIGDPYWIGPANMEQTILRAREKTSERLANYGVGDNVFILDFAYPLGTDDSDNVKLNRSEIFTGVYRVVKVTHEFADGRFIQNIEALRLPLLDLFKSTLSTKSS